MSRYQPVWPEQPSGGFGLELGRLDEVLVVSGGGWWRTRAGVIWSGQSREETLGQLLRLGVPPLVAKQVVDELYGRRAADQAARAEQEVDGWIEQNGSAGLKADQRRGLDYRDLYVFERAALEFPQWVIDVAGKVQGESLASASDAAQPKMAEVEAELEQRACAESVRPVLLSKCIWDLVPNVPAEDQWTEPGEYLRISGFLARYSLYYREAHWPRAD